MRLEVVLRIKDQLIKDAQACVDPYNTLNTLKAQGGYTAEEFFQAREEATPEIQRIRASPEYIKPKIERLKKALVLAAQSEGFGIECIVGDFSLTRKSPITITREELYAHLHH